MNQPTQEQINALPAAIGRAITLIDESCARNEEDTWEEFRGVLDINVFCVNSTHEWKFAIYPVEDGNTYTRNAFADGTVYNHK